MPDAPIDPRRAFAAGGQAGKSSTEAKRNLLRERLGAQADVGGSSRVADAKQRLRDRLAPTVGAGTRSTDLSQLGTPPPSSRNFGGPAAQDISAALTLERAEAAGVGTGGAPAGARAIQSLTHDDTVPAVKQALTAFFGEEIEVRIGKDSGAIEFLDPVTGKPELFNPPGGDVGDISALAGPAMTFTGEIVGAIAGTITQPGVGTVLLGGAGAAAGEFARLKAGQQFGLNQGLTDNELFTMAVRSAGLPAAFGESIVGPGIKFGKFLITRGRLRGVTAGSDIVGALKTEVDQLREVQGDINALLPEGSKIKFSGGDVASGVPGAEELVALEASIVRSPRGAGLVEIENSQLRATREFFEELNTRLGVQSEGDAFQFGSNFREQSLRRIKEIEKRLLADETVAIETGERVIEKSIIERAANGKSRALGRGIKNVAEVEQISASRQTAQAYLELDEIAQATAGVDAILPKSFRTSIREANKILDENILRQLDEFDRSILKEGLERTQRVTKTGGSGLFDEFGKAIPEKQTITIRPMNFSQIQGTLGALRSLERRITTGQTTDISLATVRRVKNGLIDDRAVFLKENPILAAKVEEVELFVFNTKTALDRSIIGDIVRIRRGRPVIDEEDVFGKIIKPNNATPARQVADILTKPRAGLSEETRVLYDDVLNQVRAGIRDLYENKVLKGNAVPDVKAHKKFMRDFGDTIKPFFDEGEFRKLSKLDQFTNVINEKVVRRERLLALANRTFPGELGALKNPAQIFRRVWQEGDNATLLRFMRSVRKDPKLFDEFKATALEQIRGKVIKATERGPNLDFKALQQLTTGPQGRKIATLFGDDYLRGLKTLEVAVRVSSRKTAVKTTLAKEPQALKHIARVFTGMFTAKGRVLTATQILRGRSSERVMAKTLADPELMVELMAIKALPLSHERVVRFLSGAGAYILLSAGSPRQAP